MLVTHMDARIPKQPKSIPWDLIAPHEQQAIRNHDQTLERLAERGGLAPCEAVAVLTDRPYRQVFPVPLSSRDDLVAHNTKAIEELNKIIDAYGARES